ncbi:hypothetical protein HanPI659440_Chr02g0038731 [Helianthus annuus]|nr:hypothetical protein HanPI659440_Chr02g0038731 [Helianthus annuus]
MMQLGVYSNIPFRIHSIAYEGTCWDDLAHRKGVYEDEQWLVRFGYVVCFIVLLEVMLIQCV